MDSHIQVDIVSRQSELDRLSSLLTQGHTVPCIFVYGHTATGKTLCIKRILTEKNLRNVVVECVELYSPKLIFEHILTHLCKGQHSGSVQSTRCDDVNMFARMMRKTMNENKQLKDSTLYLLFEHAERLRNMPNNILSAFTRLQELLGLPICVILETRLVWENFHQYATESHPPLKLHFTQYSKDDAIEILASATPEGCDVEFYKAYCTLIVNVFYTTTRNLRELKYLCRMNFDKYKHPVDSGTIDKSNSRALWKAIEPQLKTALNSIYLHEVSSRQWNDAQSNEEGVVLMSEMMHMKQHIELPYFSKFLLIAAYLASYNPAKSDKKFFVQNAGKLKKTVAVMRKNDRATNQLLGPKQFQLDRLMAIFYSIVDGHVQPTTHIYSQIANLISLQLLASIGPENQFDSPKYKCLVGLELIQSIARFP